MRTDTPLSGIYHVDFMEGDNVIKLPCEHCFIPDAIRTWLNNEKAECPVCREKLPADEIKITRNDLYENTREQNREYITIGEHRQSIINPEITNMERYDDSDDEDLHLAIMASIDTLANEQNNNNTD